MGKGGVRFPCPFDKEGPSRSELAEVREGSLAHFLPNQPEIIRLRITRFAERLALSTPATSKGRCSFACALRAAQDVTG